MAVKKITKIQLRRGTTEAWILSNPILLDGEIGLETNTKQFKIGDGITAWNSLAYGGLRGENGTNGNNGVDGINGQDGLSAYEVWLALGNVGSEQDFIDSLKGEDGQNALQADLLQSNTEALDYVKNKLESFIVAASQFQTDITAGTYKAYIFVPYNFYITAVEAAMVIAPVGSSAIFDLTVDGSSILTAAITIETGEYTSLTATTQPVVGTANIAAGKFILIAFTQVGSSTAGQDVEITVKGYRINTI